MVYGSKGSSAQWAQTWQKAIFAQVPGMVSASCGIRKSAFAYFAGIDYNGENQGLSENGFQTPPEREGQENGICGEKKMDVFRTSVHFYKIYCKRGHDHGFGGFSENGGK